MNVCTLIGNLTKDVELRYTASGDAVANMDIAVNSGTDEVLYMTVVVWKKQGESAAQYLSKGKKVGVTGKLKTRSWESDKGRQYKTELIAHNVEYLTPKGQSEPPKEVSDVEPF